MAVNAQQLVSESVARYWKKIEDLRISNAQKMWFWYYNERDEIISYIKTALAAMFKRKTVNRMNIRVFNIVPRVIDKLSLAYKVLPVRMVDGGLRYKLDEATKTQTPEQSENDKRYQALLKGSKISKKEGEWIKLARLFNTVLVQPVWVENGERSYMDFTIHTPAWAVVIPRDDDYLKPAAFYYPTWRTIDGQYQQVLVWWDDKEHYYIDRLGNRIPIPGNNGMINPFNRVPVAVLRLKDSADFWGEGMWDLIDGNEEVCVQVTNIYHVSVFQAHGQPVAINMGLKGEPSIGPDKPIVVENARAGEAAPDFKFVNANPNIKAVQDLIDWTIKTLQSLKGLGPQQFSIDAKLASGVAKVVDSTEIEEIRVDDTKVLADFEAELFDIVRTVYNHYNPTKKINEKAEFSIVWGEQKVVQSATEKVAERKAALELNIASRVDFILEDNPGMSREDAEEKLEAIMAENDRFKTGVDFSGLDEDEEDQKPNK